MIANDWKKVEALLSEVLELPPVDRSEFLARSCAGDNGLRAEVESLLACEVEATGFLQIPALSFSEGLIDTEEADELPGRQIGPYRIVRELGRGGMGAVFLATRADQQYEKQVAIKIIKRGLDTEDIRRRFRHERQILASLDHPNIARLIDGGTTEDGLPYFVMDYVEGAPITQYCDHRNLSTAERLNLFRTICSSVQYAHQHLVIHRDIKAGNVLVTEDGTPKLLDFGIAKLLDPARAESDAHTVTQLGVMTPEYASPEQIKGESVTTASDVYSLGVLLYELLSGQRPYRITSRRPDEIVRVICEVEPDKPSTAGRRHTGDRSKGTTDHEGQPSTESGQKSIPQSAIRNPKFLRGDLDNIVLMAMRKEPARRYASVEQFSEDIRRHLEGRPVIARKDTFGYRTSKYLRRNKVAASAAAVVLLTLIGGIIATAWEARAARAERDRARVEQLKAERTATFLQDMLGAADPANDGRNVKVVTVLNEAARRIETELAGQPDVAAQAHLTLGKTFMSLSLYDEAEPHLRKAFEFDQQLYGNDNPITAATMTQLGGLLDRQAKYAESESLLRQALVIQRRAFPQGNTDLAITLFALGGVLSNKGDHEAAVPYVQEAYELSRRVFGGKNQIAADALMSLGSIRDYEGKTDEAVTDLRQAVEMFRALPKHEQLELGEALMRLGLELTTVGKYEEAESVLRETLDFRRQTVGESHMLYADTLLNMGRVHMYERKYATAEDEMRRSLDIQLKFIPRGHPDLVQTISLLGLVLAREGKAAEGEPYLRESLEIRERVLPKGHWLTANIQSALGECLTDEKKYVEAETLLKAGYEGLKASLGDKSPRTEESLQRLVDLYERWKRPELANQYRALLSSKG